jgi:RNA 2',3'-cyclic 3'-phosphodiesterase
MRVFAGIPLPAAVKLTLKNVIEVLKNQYPGLKAVAPENLHFTLYFFGELTEPEVTVLTALMEDPSLKREKIVSRFRGFSQFPERGNPRIIHLELERGGNEVIECHGAFLSLVKQAKLDRDEDNKRFVPHLTLCRNGREKVRPGFLPALYFPREEFSLEGIVLFKSVLKTSGAEYSPLKTIAFG